MQASQELEHESAPVRTVRRLHFLDGEPDIMAETHLTGWPLVLSWLAAFVAGWTVAIGAGLCLYYAWLGVVALIAGEASNCRTVPYEVGQRPACVEVRP